MGIVRRFLPRKTGPNADPALRDALDALPEGWFLDDPVEADDVWHVLAYRTPPLGPADVILAAGGTRETCLHQVAMLLRERGGE